MKRLVLSFFACGLVFLSSPLSAQWTELYATYDEETNGTGNQVPSVAVIGENTFVAVVTRISRIYGPGYSYSAGANPSYDDVNSRDSVSMNYLVGYANADSATGRVSSEPYGSAGNIGRFKKWQSLFDEINLWRAYKAFGTPDGKVYVANNDPDHNILVFTLTPDSVDSTPYRMSTGSDDIFGLGVDINGFVYVATERATDQTTNEVKVFRGIGSPGTGWDGFHNDPPVSTINLPNGVYRGLAVSGDGTALFVSSCSDKRVSRFVGNPTTGYVEDMNFSFAISVADSIPGSAYFDSTAQEVKWVYPNPLGMAYLDENNLLFVATARWLGFNNKIAVNDISESSYHSSKIWMLDGFTGAVLDTIDVARWNLDHTGAYAERGSGTTPGNASGYGSTYDVGFDQNKNLYSQSMYGWTVEKWQYQGTLPIVTSVENTSSEIPWKYSLSQNYPNPFNPSTAIEFSLTRAHYVTLRIYNVLGREVAALADGDYPPGKYRVMFDATHLASGVYLYTLTAGEYISTKKMTLVK